MILFFDLPCTPDTTATSSKPPPAWTRIPGWEDLWNRPSPAPYNLDDDFLPGDGSLLTNLPARRSPTTRLHAYDGDAESDEAPKRPRSRPVSSLVRPRCRMRDSALVSRISKKRRLQAVRPHAVEPAGPLAEGTPEEPMTPEDSVASYPVTLCHKAEEFVSQDVVGE